MLIGWRRPAGGNFRECSHSSVPLVRIRRRRGLWLPLRAAQWGAVYGGQAGWVVGCGSGRGCTESPVVQMRVREGLASEIPFLGSAPGFLPPCASASLLRGLILKEHPGRGLPAQKQSIQRHPRILILKLEAPGEVRFYPFRRVRGFEAA